MPNYDGEVRELIGYYKAAIADILEELERIDLSDFRRANSLAVLKSITEILSELDKKAGAWAEKQLPVAVKEGVEEAILALGVVETLEEAKQVATFNRLNKSLVETVVADTQADLLAVTQNVSRKVRTTVRQVAAEVLRSNISQGVNGAKSIKRDLLQELRKKLGEAANTGIVDAAGRRWRPDDYVDMLARTKLMNSYRESTQNEAVSREAYYGIISRHGAKDACKNWEGRVIKLTPDAPGSYPYIGNLPQREIFHPRCRHVVSPIRNPERY
jgi:hypothetical protein